MKLLILGDSISSGWGAEKGYADYLLNDYAGREKIEIYNYSVPGSIITDGLNRLPEILPTVGQIDYFICNFGTNDGLPSIYGGEVRVSLSEFKQGLVSLLELLPDSVGLIFLGTVSSFEPEINQSLVLYNQVIRDFALQKKGIFIDLYSLLLLRPELLQGDGLHPNDLGHRILADKLNEVIHF